MAHRLPAACIALALAVSPLTLTGCSNSSSCFPAPVKATPASTTAGGAVMVSSPAASCDLDYSDGHTYSIVLSNHGTTTDAISVPVAKDGTFRAMLEVPGDFPRGDAFVLVKGSPYDNCKDSGSCAGYGIQITVK